MSEGYTREERAELEEALGHGEAPACPACGGALARREVQAPPGVPYVRHRALLICTACKRMAAVDVRVPGEDREQGA